MTENNHESDDNSIHLIYNRVKADIENIAALIERKIENKELPKVKYSYVLREGLPEDEILSYANKYRPTLIVMGTRGKNRKNIELIGSVTAEIIESSRVPLLIIPEEISFNLNNTKNVAFATSFNQQDLNTFDKFVGLMQYEHPHIHLFNISTSKNEWNEIRLTGVHSYLSKQYPDLQIDFTVLDDGDLRTAIDKFVQEKKIDFIALTTYRRSLITRIFNPSIARKMLFHTNTALFVMPKTTK